MIEGAIAIQLPKGRVNYEVIRAEFAVLNASEKNNKKFPFMIIMALLITGIFLVLSLPTSTSKTSNGKAGQPKVAVDSYGRPSTINAEDYEPNFIAVNGQVVPNPRIHKN